MWFQQDGAPPHYSRAARETLIIEFPDRWIGRGGLVNWPARSPDLTPSHFYLWGHMKSFVFETNVESEEDLIALIAVAAGDSRKEKGVPASTGIFGEALQAVHRTRWEIF